jgi:mannose/fructose/sorbose-specific phosphotransferase system IIB component
MPISLIRIDDRLIHGQVVVGWSKFIQADHIIVADDKVAGDITQRMLYEMVVPPGMKVNIFTIREAAEFLKSNQNTSERIILLFSTPQDVLSYSRFGGPVKSLNVGGMRYEPGKRQIAQSISMDDADAHAFRELRQQGIEIEGRAVPTDHPLDISRFI